MPKIAITRTNIELPAEMDAARQLLFACFDGFTREDKRAWRRLWKKLLALEPGELAELSTEFARSGAFHRRHMKIEQTVFDAQESFVHFSQFRDWLKIGAGHVDWKPGPRGGIVPIPKSIDYRSLDDEAFRVFHDKTIGFLRTEHAGKALWPKITPTGRTEMIETLLGGFGE